MQSIQIYRLNTIVYMKLAQKNKKKSVLKHWTTSGLQLRNANRQTPVFERCACPQAMLEVTDGWYCLPCKPDTALQDLIGRKKLAVGQKIVTTGAELAGSQESCSPLEVSVFVLFVVSVFVLFMVSVYILFMVSVFILFMVSVFVLFMVSVFCSWSVSLFYSWSVCSFSSWSVSLFYS